MKNKKVVPRNTNQYQYLASEYIVKDKDLLMIGGRKPVTLVMG